MVVSWVLFPLVLIVLSWGCGLLLEVATGASLPPALVPSAGLAVVIVAAQFPALSATTVELAAPLVVVLALAGFVLSGTSVRRPQDPWAIAVGAGTFLVFAAPFVLSGENTFGGYIKLDDTASWLAITDRVMGHGPSVGQLAPSTYEATLDFYLNSHYPIGGFLPLGIGGVLLGTDIVWLYQPFLALLAGMLALALYSLAGTLIESRPLRALAAFVAAQPALLFGYALWGGIKELTTAWLVALTAALVPIAVRGQGSPRTVIPIAVASAATVAAVSFGGGIWLAPLLLPALAAIFVGRGWERALRQAAAFAVVGAALLIPSLRTIDFLGERAASTITNGTRLANLIQPLSGLQLFGIWPAGDFRLRPDDMVATYVLVAIVVVMGTVGVWSAISGRAGPLLLYVGAAGASCLLVTTFASPWVGAKALTIASPAFMLIAIAGVIALLGTGRLTEGLVIGCAIFGGVLWSNALAFRDVNLAPHDRFEELRAIGSKIAGQGPTLMTDYEPYGARYFLRHADPEGASELRRRVIPLRGGGSLDKLEVADIDRFQLPAVLTYRTLVLRRSPVGSRPPATYRRVWGGRYYEAWQRPDAGVRPVLEHLPLGTPLDPGAVPRCSQVLAVAHRAGRAGVVAAVRRGRPVVVGLDDSPLPAGWSRYGNHPGAVYPSRAGTISADFELRRGGAYSLWVQGAFRSRLELRIDGTLLWSGRNDLSHAGEYVLLAHAPLSAGLHHLDLAYRGADLHPGSGGAPFALGPFVLARDTANEPVTYVRPDRAGSLCGQRLDWVEALGR